VDDAKVGRALRQLRRRRGLRQKDVAGLARLAQQTISLIECGHAAAFTIDTIRRAFGALGASYEGLVVRRGAALDRLLDERHAALVGMTGERLPAPGWEVVFEASYSIYGERGSIDILAGHATTRSVLVVEVKSDLMSIEVLGRKLDEKARLARRQLCRDRFGWPPTGVGRLLVLLDLDSARRAVARNAALLDRLFPACGLEVRQWLRRPGGDLNGILYVADTNTGSSMSPIPIRLVLDPGGAAGSGSVGRIQLSSRADESTPRPKT
jgi:transcriptional regulator with XRE-family HTH domain